MPDGNGVASGRAVHVLHAATRRLESILIVAAVAVGLIGGAAMLAGGTGPAGTLVLVTVVVGVIVGLSLLMVRALRRHGVLLDDLPVTRFALVLRTNDALGRGEHPTIDAALRERLLRGTRGALRLTERMRPWVFVVAAVELGFVVFWAMHGSPGLMLIMGVGALVTAGVVAFWPRALRRRVALLQTLPVPEEPRT